MMIAGPFNGTPAARIRAAGVALLLTIAACGHGEASPPSTADQPTPAAAAPAGRIVDSILPIEEELRRFQAGLPRSDSLTGGATSRDALVRRFVDRLSRRDTAALREMVLTRSEFAYLVYPTGSYTRPPYRTAPGLVWLQLSQGSAKGLTRLLRDELQVRDYVGHRCDARPAADGGVTLWRQCRVQVMLAGGDTLDARLFGVIVERGGHHKFASFANDF